MELVVVSDANRLRISWAEAFYSESFYEWATCKNLQIFDLHARWATLVG